MYDSLAKKGFIEWSGMGSISGKTAEYVCVTPEDLKALKAAKGVN